MDRLKGKTAFVTGASRGIGRAIALRLAEEGADVLINFRENASAASEVVGRVEALGRRGQAYRADTSNLGQARQMLAEIRKDWGSFDILVNNAGVLTLGGLADTREEDFDRMFAVNVKGLFFLTQEALPLLCDGGRIINVSSIVSKMARYPDMIAYAGSKAAVDCFTRQWALELGPRNITVNAIGPGIIETDMAIAFHANPKVREKLIRESALGRMGQPEDIADVALFLASDESRWVTGQHINTSGGYFISG